MKTIIEMAREAGLVFNEEHGTDIAKSIHLGRVQAFAALVRADEREACAKLFPQPYIEYCGEEIQAIIRARGNT